MFITYLVKSFSLYIFDKILLESSFKTSFQVVSFCWGKVDGILHPASTGILKYDENVEIVVVAWEQVLAGKQATKTD